MRIIGRLPTQRRERYRRRKSHVINERGRFVVPSLDERRVELYEEFVEGVVQLSGGDPVFEGLEEGFGDLLIELD